LSEILMDDVSAGARHACARFGASLYCWGDDRYGQCGAGEFQDAVSGATRVCSTCREQAVQVRLASEAALIATGERNTFAVLRDGTVWGWGDNSHMQLGSLLNEKDPSCRAEECEMAHSKPVLIDTSGIEAPNGPVPMDP
jgi:alpha-tubulin suppressor-like RCC1 family protein